MTSALTHLHLPHARRHTDNEPRAALLRLIAPGGRAAEKMGAGPDGFGSVVVGTRTLSEAGTVADWRRDQVRACRVQGRLGVCVGCLRTRVFGEGGDCG